MFSLAHYGSLRAVLLPGSVRGISGHALDKYSFDSVVILRCQRIAAEALDFEVFKGILENE